MENKLLNFLNLKLNLTLTGNEIKLDLHDKNIGNTELILLTGIDFKNLEELNLSKNNISEPKYIEEFNSKKLKKIDLSFNNNICNINSINSIYNSDKNLPPKKNFKIILDHNSIKKDINEIKNLIINDNNESNPTKKIQKLSDDEYNPENNKFFTCSNFYNNSNNNRKNEIKEKLLIRIEKLEKKILEYFNINLSMNLTGKEKKINLSNKNIGNIELNLLNGVEFKNLEEIDLSNNKITDIKPINSFKKVKKLDLSFNKINDIKALENNKQLEKINLSNNEIKDVEVLKKNIFPNIIEINLDNNNIIKKDIDEIKNIIKENLKIIPYKGNEDLRKYYDIENKIGNSSSFDSIFSARKKDEYKDLRAIRIFDKKKFKDEFSCEYLRIPTEKDINPYIESCINLVKNMRTLEGTNKENINTVKLYEYYNNENEFAIIMELCDDNLLNFILNKRNPLNPKEIYEILIQLNNSLKIMNENNIIHGKLTLENILLKYENEDKTKFIIKLKLSYKINNIENYSEEEIMENLAYLAPEILEEKFIEKDLKKKCDLWSLGVIIYILSFKEYPYDGYNPEEILNKIKINGQKEIKKTLDEDLNNLIHSLLIEDPNKRISWEDYFNHPFFNKKNNNFNKY